MINLMQGDCLERMKEIPDSSVDMVLTDPPYGITLNKWDSVLDSDLMWLALMRVIKPNGAIVLFGAEPFASNLRMSNIKQFKYDWDWIKEAGTGFLNAKKQPLRNRESAMVFYKKQPTYNPQMRLGFKPYSCKQGHVSNNYGKVNSEIITISNGERYPLTTLEFKRDKDKYHPTQKPVALMEYLIKTYTNENETVLDFTMGSGTTGVACVNTNRKFIGIEMDETYFDIASERIERTILTCEPLLIE